MISFKSVSFRYGIGKTVLDGVNLDVRPGELVAIAGPNGAGKTTLVKHMNRLLRPTKGTVTVFGEDTRKSTIAGLSRRVGLVFQNPNNQIFCQTVEEEVEFGLRNFDLPENVIKQRVEWALKLFSLDNYRSSSPFSLSGGEKKRLCLACVLAWEPDVLILDEPTIGQDSNHKEVLTEMIRVILAQERTVVVVSHDMEFLWPLQPRLVILNQGRLVYDGTMWDFFAKDDRPDETALLSPQLVQIWRGLRARPDRAFADVQQAASWIVQHRGVMVEPPRN